MSLKDYMKKRVFSKTSEPKNSVTKFDGKKKIFVIHEHHASHLHWDLRLEIRGVLKSWAVPKQPPRAKHTKRLAIQVEDHPLSYANFEGEIPEGNYGAGRVQIWDKGELKILSFDDDKKIEFEIHGKKLDGKYVLVKTEYGSKPEKSWLFFRVG